MGGRKLPYGWKWLLNDKGEKVEVTDHEGQVTVIRWLAELYAEGTSTIELARQLTEAEVPPPEGQPGDQWHTIMIRRILSNERLTGKAQNFFYHNRKAKRTS